MPDCAAIVTDHDVVARTDGDRVLVDTANDTVVTGTGGDLIGPTECAKSLDSGQNAIGVANLTVITNDGSVAISDMNNISCRATEYDSISTG